jgi:hypothetical protein
MLPPRRVSQGLPATAPGGPPRPRAAAGGPPLRAACCTAPVRAPGYSRTCGRAARPARALPRGGGCASGERGRTPEEALLGAASAQYRLFALSIGRTEAYCWE